MLMRQVRRSCSFCASLRGPWPRQGCMVDFVGFRSAWVWELPMTRPTGDWDCERDNEGEVDELEEDELEEDLEPGPLHGWGCDFDVSCKGECTGLNDASKAIEWLPRIMVRPRLVLSKDAPTFDTLALQEEGTKGVGPSLSSAGSIAESGMVETLAGVVLKTSKIMYESFESLPSIRRLYTSGVFAWGQCVNGEVGVLWTRIDTVTSLIRCYSLDNAIRLTKKQRGCR